MIPCRARRLLQTLAAPDINEVLPFPAKVVDVVYKQGSQRITHSRTLELAGLAPDVVVVFVLQCFQVSFLVFALCVFLFVSFVARDVIVPAVKLCIVEILSELRLFARAEAVVVIFILESECCYIMISVSSQLAAIFETTENLNVE